MQVKRSSTVTSSFTRALCADSGMAQTKEKSREVDKLGLRAAFHVRHDTETIYKHMVRFPFSALIRLELVPCSTQSAYLQKKGAGIA